MGSILVKIPIFGFILRMISKIVWFLLSFVIAKNPSHYKALDDNNEFSESDDSISQIGEDINFVKQPSHNLSEIQRDGETDKPDREALKMSRCDESMEIDDQDTDSEINDEYFKPLQSCQTNFEFFKKKIIEGHILLLNITPASNDQDDNNESNTDNQFNDIWDNYHVKMPFSPKNNVYGQDINKWEIINDKLKDVFTSGGDVEEAIKSFNNLSKFDFDVLRQFIDNNGDGHFDALKIINEMSQKVLELPLLFPEPIPLLRKQENRLIILSKEQIASLLMNAFFCTFPRRSKANREYERFPLFNFASLYSSGDKSNQLKIKTEKLKCIFNYFNRILTDENSTGSVSFERRSLSPHQMPDWGNSEKPLIKVKVQNSGRMDIVGKVYSVVDFANKFIGGGVLSTGCVQEEILFLINPELLASKLFLEALDDNEAVVITGHSLYNSNEGYSKSFQWTGDYMDDERCDDLGRKFRQIIAIDALNFNNYEKYIQFEEDFIERELNKAYVGFQMEGLSGNESPAIATGKWGCGVFKGDPALKYLIQLLAASEAERNVIFYTFNDTEFGRRLKHFNDSIEKTGLTVKQLFHLICEFQNSDHAHLFDFIIDSL